MIVSSSSTVSGKETTFLKQKYNEKERLHAPFSLTRASSSASSSSSASVSRNDDSVPSLYQAAASERNNHDSQLAFTTEDLQITPKNSTSRGSSRGGTAIVAHHHPIVPSRPGSLKSNKTRFVRHGLMRASTSDLLDSINKRQGTPASATGGAATNDPPKNAMASSNMSYNNGAPGLQLRARPTVTTILRQQHVLEKAEKKEKDKLESLMVSNAAFFEVDNLSKEQDKKKAEETKAAESKRFLQARLAYEKAIAASRKMAVEKQRIAESTRQKEKEWQTLLEKQRELEKERRKTMMESLQRANYDSKRAIDEMLRSKQLKASKVKQEMEQLQAEARQKKEEEEMRRQDKIQQIQAAKLALKRTKETMGNPNQFYRSIAIPETQIKLRLQKEEERRKLQETRQKIQAAKQLKSVKLIRAMKKIQSCESLARKQQQEQEQQLNAKQRPFSSSANKFTSNNDRPFTFSGKASASYLKKDGNNNSSIDANNTGLNSTKVEEINEMMEQLNQLKSENYQRRLNEKLQRAQSGAVAGGSRSTVKIIGASVNSKNNDSLKNTNFYRHRSHYGIHV